MTRTNRFLPLLLPLLPLIPALASFRLLGGDAEAFIQWWLFLSIPGLIFLPLSSHIFKQSPDHGYLFAKPLALLLSGLAVWSLSYLHVLPFRPIVIYGVITAAAIVVHWPQSNRQFWTDMITKPRILLYWALEESLLGFTMLFWTFARGLSPALDSLEKFMDYGFMMSLWRTDFLPAVDMWLAGSSINYYYFGQYLMTYWAKAAGIHPEKAYNLAMASLFALTFCLSFSTALLIGSIARRSGRRINKAMPVAFASVSAILLTMGGNGHIFYYGGNAIGRWLHNLFSGLGLSVGTVSDFYWFADATRYIGYNPETADKTIHEFPYYSFLVNDLHAHVVSLVPVLLLLGLLAVLISRQKERKWTVAGFGIDPIMLLMAAILAVFMMGNYWDFVIYFAVSCMVILFRSSPLQEGGRTWIAFLLTMLEAFVLMTPFILFENVYAAILAYGFAALTSWMILTRYPHPLTETGAKASWLFLMAHLIALPFNSHFEPIAKSIKRTVSQTPLIQLWVLYGFLVIAGIVMCVDILHEPGQTMVRAAGPFPPRRSARRFMDRIFDLSASDRLMLIFFICGIGLLIVPELVYVVDIYGGEYKRANTMFKFTYQAFILLSFVLAYAPLRLLTFQSRLADRPSSRRIAGAFMLLLFVPTLLYPMTVTRQWLGAFSIERYQGIDGIKPFSLKDSASIPGTAPGELADDYAAVQWFNQQVAGQPVILESFGDSYTDYCRISAYTGLPTVMGWQTHEWLWRTSKATPDAYQGVVVPRQTHVRTMYTSTNEQEVRQLIDRYEVRYIVIGNLERSKFAVVGTDGKPTAETLVNEPLLLSLGTVAFQSNDLIVIAVN